MKIILASKSPRRSEILKNIGIDFEVIESNYDEIFDINMTPDEIVTHLAYKKAESVSKTIKDEAYVIGADTIVVLDSRIMGKPHDIEESFEMLKSLSGKWHRVYSGICVIKTISSQYFSGFEATDVKIKELSDKEIHGYINTGESLDKAGSYAIQGVGSLLVEKINGCYFNIVGLPVFKLFSLLEKFGINLLELRG